MMKNKNERNKLSHLNSKFHNPLLTTHHSGITLIALVVTVVVLLILAGITINMVFNDNGIFKVAQNAGEKQEIEAIRERIETIRISYWTKKKVDNSIGLDEFWNELVKANIITDKDDEDQVQGPEAGVNNTEIYTVITTDGYSVEMIVDSNGNVAIGEIEKATNLTSKIKNIVVTNKMSSSISISIFARLQAGEVNAYYKILDDVAENEAEESTNGYTQITLNNNLEGTASQLTAGEYKIKVLLKNGEEVVDVKSIEVTVLEEGQIPYSWEELNKIAEAISNNTSYDENTENISVTVDGETKTLEVGDWTRIDGRKVRILGFNHDTLTSNTAYGGRTTASGKAGISFEYLECLIDSSPMHSSNDNTNGWIGKALYATLNNTTNGKYIDLQNAGVPIKQVQKLYNAPVNVGDNIPTTSSDYLWLLSCSEIWGDSAYTGCVSGYSKAEEGNQYAFYANCDPKPVYNSENDNVKHYNSSGTSADRCWLRSPYFTFSTYFCYVMPYSDFLYTGEHGGCGYNYASNSYAIAPGFCI